MRIICGGIHQVKQTTTKLQEIIAKLQQHFPQNLRNDYNAQFYLMHSQLRPIPSFECISCTGGKEIGEVARNGRSCKVFFYQHNYHVPHIPTVAKTSLGPALS